LVSLPRAAGADERRETAQGPAPFQFSLWDTVQVVDRERPIHGVRLTLPYGSNREVHGLDMGFVNHVGGDLRGVQLSLAGYVTGDFEGLQYNFALSVVEARAVGAQFAVYAAAQSLKGAQFGLVNRVEGDSTGARLSLVNVAEAESTGFELGAVNYAQSFEGLQLGLVNVTERLDGVQVGLVNVASNGFLPVFVFVNAAL
jgi:hypothetical protein